MAYISERMKIDLGCSKNKIPGTVGIDADPHSDADIIVNFEKDPIPLEDNSVSHVSSKQVFEHLEDPERVLKELYRIVKPEGEIFVEVPHYSSYIAHGIGHKQYYSQKELVQMFRETISCEIVKSEITFYKLFKWLGIKYLANKFPKTYEKFWAYRFPAENLKITARVKKNQQILKETPSPSE